MMSSPLMPSTLNELLKHDFILAKKIYPHLNSPLKKYLKYIFPKPLKSKNSSFDLLVRAMEQFSQRHHLEPVSNFSKLLINTPCIQQADHSNLLLDRETFYNNLLHAESARLNNCDYIFTSQCSIVSCITRRSPIFGPTILNYNDDVYKVFDDSNRTLKDSNFCTLSSSRKFEISSLYNPEKSKDFFLQHIDGLSFATAEQAYLYANEHIWNNIKYTKGIKRISFDETLISELAILHLRDIHSPFYKLIMDKDIRDNFIKTKRSYVASKSNKSINSSYPDFFWLRKKNKLRALKLDLNTSKFKIFQTNEDGISINSVDDIIKLLEEKVIYLDRMMAYFLRCLLPNIVAIGGTSQQDYLNSYQEIFQLANEKTSFLNDNYKKSIQNKDLSQFGGAPLIEGKDIYFK